MFPPFALNVVFRNLYKKIYVPGARNFKKRGSTRRMQHQVKSKPTRMSMSSHDDNNEMKQTVYTVDKFPFADLVLGDITKKTQGKLSIQLLISECGSDGKVRAMPVFVEMTGRLAFPILGGKFGPQCQLRPTSPEFGKLLRARIIELLYPMRNTLWPAHLNVDGESLSKEHVGMKVKAFLKPGGLRATTDKYTPQPGETYEPTLSAKIDPAAVYFNCVGQPLSAEHFPGGSDVTTICHIGQLYGKGDFTILTTAAAIKLNSTYVAPSSLKFSKPFTATANASYADSENDDGFNRRRRDDCEMIEEM